MSTSHDDEVFYCIDGKATPPEDWPESAWLVDVQQVPSAQGWYDVAERLATGGLIRSAGAAFLKALEDMPSAAGRAVIYQRWGQLEMACGLTESGETRHRVARRLLGETEPGRLLEIETADGWVMCRANDPQAFAEMRAGLGATPLDDDPFRGDGPVLPAIDISDYLGAKQDFSFAVLSESGALLLVLCTVTGDSKMSCGEVAVQLTRLRGEVPDWAIELALKQLSFLTRWSGAGRVLVEDDQSVILRQWASQRPNRVNSLAYCELDLSKPMDVLRREYRETHRQQVAWGRKHLRVEKLADPASLYDGFSELYHAKHLVPQFTPQSLGQPGVNMFVAWDGDDLASVVVTSDFGKCCYYTAGARMEGSKKPLTHVLIDTAIEDAKARGMARFSFGALHLDAASGEKLQGIAGFKRGFAAQLQPIQWITVRP